MLASRCFEPRSIPFAFRIEREDRPVLLLGQGPRRVWRHVLGDEACDVGRGVKLALPKLRSGGRLERQRPLESLPRGGAPSFPRRSRRGTWRNGRQRAADLPRPAPRRSPRVRSRPTPRSRPGGPSLLPHAVAERIGNAQVATMGIFMVSSCERYRLEQESKKRTICSRGAPLEVSGRLHQEQYVTVLFFFFFLYCGAVRRIAARLPQQTKPGTDRTGPPVGGRRNEMLTGEQSYIVLPTFVKSFMRFAEWRVPPPRPPSPRRWRRAGRGFG